MSSRKNDKNEFVNLIDGSDWRSTYFLASNLPIKRKEDTGIYFPFFYSHWLIYRDFYVNLQRYSMKPSQ